MYIHTIAFLLICQSFVACQQDAEINRLSEANLIVPSSAAGRENPAKAQPSASNVVFQSVDGGQSWQDVSNGLPIDFQLECVFAGSGEIFMASENELYHGNVPSLAPLLYRGGTAPAAPAWAKEDFPGTKITGIFPGRGGPYVCYYGSGFYQKIQGTGDWKPMHNALNDNTIRSVLETPDGTVFVACDSGIYKSVNGGKSWKQVFSEGVVSSLVAADGVLVGGGFKGLLRSTDGGEHWDWVLTEDGAVRSTGLVEGRFVAITNGQEANRLRTSADGGQTWQVMDEHLSPARFFYDMAKADQYLSPVRYIYDIKQAGDYLFCSHEAGVFRSADRGKTWELVFPATSKMTAFELAVSGQVIYAIKKVGGC